MADDTTKDTTLEAETAREEVVQTEPAKAPLPDPAGLAHNLSPVDLPEPETPLAKPLSWTVTVMATAGLFLALFNSEAIRGWSYELKPTRLNQQIVGYSEQWYDFTAAMGLSKPDEALRGWWKAAQALRFPGQVTPETETGPGEGPPEPAA